MLIKCKIKYLHSENRKNERKHAGTGLDLATSTTSISKMET
jgi:hypothetical protein